MIWLLNHSIVVDLNNPEAMEAAEAAEAADTWIFPSIQMGPFDVRHDSDLTERFLRSGAEGSKFKFATGYFNLTKDYKQIMLNASKGGSKNYKFSHFLGKRVNFCRFFEQYCDIRAAKFLFSLTRIFLSIFDWMNFFMRSKHSIMII